MNKDTHTETQYVEEFRRLLYDNYRVDIDKGPLKKKYIIARKSYILGENVEDVVANTAEMFKLIQRR